MKTGEGLGFFLSKIAETVCVICERASYRTDCPSLKLTLAGLSTASSNAWSATVD
jgi:hypothetical protein